MVLTSISSPLVAINGTLQLSVDAAVIRDRIITIISTQPFERVMQPLLGVRDLTFDSVSNTAMIVEVIRQALDREMGSYVYFDIQGQTNDDGSVTLNVNYTVNQIPQETLTVAISWRYCFVRCKTQF